MADNLDSDRGAAPLRERFNDGHINCNGKKILLGRLVPYQKTTDNMNPTASTGIDRPEVGVTGDCR
jgi:hypothetical protein